MGKVFSVSMNKGGVGKTSLLTNLGAALSKTGKKVLIVDTDGQGNVSVAFGLNPVTFENTIYDVMLGKIKLKDTIISIVDNLDIVPANDDMDFLDFDILPNLKIYDNPFRLLGKHIDEVRDQYDYILIDTPPSLTLIAGNVFSCVDHVLIPFVPEIFGVKGIIRIIKSIEGFKERENPDLKIAGVVSMMVDGRTNLHSKMLQQAKEYCQEKGINIFETVIPKSIRFANATAYDGKPAVLTDGTNTMVSSYFNLMQEVIQYGEGEPITV